MRATINGVELYYETIGAGPPLLLLHGGPGMGDGRGYRAALAPLADEFTLIIYDHRGCGRSGDAPPETYTHAQFAADAEGLRRHLGLGPVAMLGTSYGGFIALEYALRYPAGLRGLVLVGTAASNEHHAAARANALASGLPGIEPATLDRLFGGRIRDNADFRRSYGAIAPLYSPNFDPATLEARLDDTPFRYETHNRMFGHELPRYDLRPRLSEIAAPTLVICGRHDWICPLAESELLARSIPGARLVVFEGSGHGPMRDENAAFLAELRAFLRRVFAGPRGER